MNITEVRAMCRWLTALVPHQQLDDETPEAWCPLLASVAVQDARTAVLAVLERDRYVDPRAIRAEVRRIRAARLDAAGYRELTPNVDPADAPAFAAEQRALRDAIADGRMGPDEVAAYEAFEVPPLTAAPAFRSPAPLVARDMARVLGGVS